MILRVKNNQEKFFILFSTDEQFQEYINNHYPDKYVAHGDDISAWNYNTDTNMWEHALWSGF